MTKKEAYSKREKSINDLLGVVKSKVKTTGRDFKKNPNNWGYVGSLGYVEARLKEIVEFFGK